MIMVYFLMILLGLIVVNRWVLWILMEMRTIFFFLVVLRLRDKSFGLVIYYFFHSFLSLLLFLSLLYEMNGLVSLVLLAKLGLFPFFYWLVVVVIKVGLWARVLVLVYQKIVVFWMFWLVREISIRLIVFIIYLRLIFVFLTLLIVVDLWMLIVYSSISNTSLILMGSYGDKYVGVIMLYLGILFLVLFLFKYVGLKEWYLILVFMLIVVPPFGLFYMKLLVFLSLDFVMVLVFLLSLLDVLILLYYFSLLFFRFMLMEIRLGLYVINFLILVMVVVGRRYVTLVYINES